MPEYRVEIAENARHACRAGVGGIAVAIIACDALGPAEAGLVQELRTAVGNVLWSRRPWPA